MKNWHEKLKTAMAQREVPAARLAEHLGIKPPSVSDWLSGKTKNMKGEYVPSVCSYLNIEAEWLFNDEGPSGLQDLENFEMKSSRKVDPKIRRVPVLSKIPAGGPKQIIDAYIMGEGMEDIATDITVGRYAFALIIEGVSMEPEFKTGDKVIIDPDVRPHPGDYVAARCNGDEGTFKKYRPRGADDNGIEVFELVPLNEDYPIIRSDKSNAEIIGTMVEHRKYRRIR